MALSEQGYGVTLVGRYRKHSAAVQRPYQTVRMRLLFSRSVWFYAEYNVRLFLRLCCSKVDLIYANDTDTLLACYAAARLRRRPLVFDAHELFPEVPELVGRPKVKRAWERIEHYVLCRMGRKLPGAACITVCQSIADYYGQRYGVSMSVVRNVSDESTQDHSADRAVLDELGIDLQGRRMLLYQGAVNVGRGVEWVMQAMPRMKDVVLVVAGEGDLYATLRQQAAQQHDRVLFLGRVEPTQLRRLTPHASLGLVLLDNLGLNYFYSLPNRIADFAWAGVPVLATDFPEIHRVVSHYGIGSLLADGAHRDTERLAAAVEQTLAEWSVMAPEEKARRFDAARNELSWNKDKRVLQQAVASAMGTDHVAVRTAADDRPKAERTAHVHL